MANRLLGILGVMGGLALLAAWVVTIPTADLFNLRLVLFTGGSMAVIVAIGRPYIRSGISALTVTAVVAFVANAVYLAMIVVAVAAPGDLRPADFHPGFFVAALALWLSDAGFGFASLRLAGVMRWGALALGAGSLLAVTGIDRLGLTTAANPTIFATLSQVGLALNGIGWVVLGLGLALGSRWLPALGGRPTLERSR